MVVVLCWWWWSHHHHSATTRVVDTNLEILTPAPHVVHVTNMRYGALAPLCNEFLLPWKDKCTHCSFRIPKPCKMYYVELHCASLNPELRGGSPPQAQPLPLDWPWLRSLPRKDRSNEDDDNDRLGSIWRTNWSPFFYGDGIKLSVSTNFLENYNLFAS